VAQVVECLPSKCEAEFKAHYHKKLNTTKPTNGTVVYWFIQGLTHTYMQPLISCSRDTR
jgi:hypothetical protein